MIRTSAFSNLSSIASIPKIRHFLEASIATSTRRAYQNDLDHFFAWGGHVPATAETIAEYLAHHAAKLATGTLARRLAAIGRAHTIQGLPNPARSELVLPSCCAPTR